MNRLNLRRVAAVAAGALIGLAGVATVASPAAAHNSIVTGTACKLKSGDLRVDWMVANSEGDLAGKITSVWTPSATAITGIAAGTVLPKSTDGALLGQQIVLKGKDATLKISAEWYRGKQHITNTATGTVKAKGNCKEEPTPKPTHSGSPSPSASPAPSESVGPSPSESVEPSLSASPAPSESVEPSPSESVEPSPTPNEPEPTPQPEEPTGPLVPEEPNAPDFEVIFTCDALIVTADNPADGVEATIVFTTDKGETKKLELIPGKKTEVTFEAYEGLTITPSFEGEKGDPEDAVAWEKPAECDGGQGGGLPVTGAAIGGIVGGAAVLLAAGAVLFVVARRRRVRFTA